MSNAITNVNLIMTIATHLRKRTHLSRKFFWNFCSTCFEFRRKRIIYCPWEHICSCSDALLVVSFGKQIVPSQRFWCNSKPMHSFGPVELVVHERTQYLPSNNAIDWLNTEDYTLIRWRNILKMKADRLLYNSPVEFQLEARQQYFHYFQMFHGQKCILVLVQVSPFI